MVEDIAIWIGLCTREANHFSVPVGDGKVKYLRDTTARSCPFAKAKRAFFKAVGVSMKRKAPSMSGVNFVARVPGFSEQAVKTVEHCARTEFSGNGSCGARVKRHKLSDKQMEDKANFCFMEYWLAQREQAPKPNPPPVSASCRKAAMLARLAARSSSSFGDG